MKTTFLSRSSSGEPYIVSFESDGAVVIVKCTCKAGALLQQCKHKRAIVRGDKEMLFDGSEEERLQTLLGEPEVRALQRMLEIEERELEAVEKEKARLAVAEKAIKARIAELFARGGL